VRDPGVASRFVGTYPRATICHAFSVKTQPLPQVGLTRGLPYARATAHCSLPAIPRVFLKPATIHDDEQPRVLRALGSRLIDHTFL
jgi:hypothetical protein